MWSKSELRNTNEKKLYLNQRSQKRAMKTILLQILRALLFTNKKKSIKQIDGIKKKSLLMLYASM